MNVQDRPLQRAKTIIFPKDKKVEGKDTQIKTPDPDTFEQSDGSAPKELSGWKKFGLKAAQVGTAAVGLAAGGVFALGLAAGATAIGTSMGAIGGIVGFGAVALGAYYALDSDDTRTMVLAGGIASGAAAVLTQADPSLVTSFLGNFGHAMAIGGGLALTVKAGIAGWKIPKLIASGDNQSLKQLSEDLSPSSSKYY